MDGALSTTDLLAWLGFAVLGFLIGSIPFGLIIAKRHGIDIRHHGSGNIGATNVRRVLGKKPGTICLMLDVLKGLVPTLAAGLVMGTAGTFAMTAPAAWAWLGVMAMPVLGHVLCPWIGFKGGKGVATGLGTLVGVFPALTVPGVLAAAVWITTVKTTRYVGVASCAAALSLPALAWVWLTVGPGLLDRPSGARLPFAVVTGILAVLVVIRHRGNLSRTLAGTEPKIDTPNEPARSA